MQREKQIEEIAREMCHLSAECKTCQICNERYHGDNDDLCYFKCVAKEIINHGFRKQSEVVKEIFEEIDNIIYNLRDSPFYSSSDAVDELTELKKKYIGELQDAEIH